VCTHTLDLRFGVPHSPLVRGFRPSRGFYPPTRPMWPTSNVPVASPTPVFVGPVCSRLRVGPPGQKPPRPYLPLLRDQQRLPRSGTSSIDRGLFALAELAFRLGTNSHRAASRAIAPPSCAAVESARPEYESAVGAPTHRSRIARRLLHPRLRLRPRFLVGEEGSTPWTRPPFTPRPPCGWPGLLTGGGASVRPTVIAYRLLQPVTTTYEHTHELWSSQRDEGRNPLRVL